MSQYDVIVVGGGIVGMTMALALAKKTSLTIALVEAKSLPTAWQADPVQQRVSAISLATQRIFQNVSVWNAMQAKRVSPYQKMVVWDELGSGEIQFDSAAIQTKALGHIIEDDVMRASLFEKIKECANITVYAPLHLLAVHQTASEIVLDAETDVSIQAKLLVAADGGHSWVRDQVGIAVDEKAYHHTALVAQVQTELPHQATAWQHFTIDGPLAFLPLKDSHTCSIVWSVSPEKAAALLALDDEAFKQALSQACSKKLGVVTHVSTRAHFPLRYSHAKQYVQARVALVGDAAHTIHPLAGQGVNLGLLDVASLVDVIVATHQKGRDIGAYHALRPYERHRKGDNALMLFTVSGIKTLFCAQSTPLRRVRNLGLNAVNRFGELKKFIMRYAVGHRHDMTSLTAHIVKSALE